MLLIPNFFYKGSPTPSKNPPIKNPLINYCRKNRKDCKTAKQVINLIMAMFLVHDVYLEADHFIKAKGAKAKMAVLGDQVTRLHHWQFAVVGLVVNNKYAGW